MQFPAFRLIVVYRESGLSLAEDVWVNDLTAPDDLCILSLVLILRTSLSKSTRRKSIKTSNVFNMVLIACADN